MHWDQISNILPFAFHIGSSLMALLQVYRIVPDLPLQLQHQGWKKLETKCYGLLWYLTNEYDQKVCLINENNKRKDFVSDIKRKLVSSMRTINKEILLKHNLVKVGINSMEYTLLLGTISHQLQFHISHSTFYVAGVVGWMVDKLQIYPAKLLFNCHVYFMASAQLS